MKPEDKMDEDEKRILEEMRAQSKLPNTPEAFLYGLLRNSHPMFVEAIEAQTVKYKKAIERMSKHTKKAEQDPSDKSVWETAINNRSPEFNSDTTPFDSGATTKTDDDHTED